jgi:tRNA(Ile)-lysidine synthase
VNDDVALELQRVLSKRNVSGSLVVAFSGGVDSVVLLHAVSNFCKKNASLSCRAIHINHGLQPSALSWQAHCEKLCQQLDVPFQSMSVEVLINKDQSMESAARLARYRALFSALNDGEVLLTAHHQNDQAETVMLQLMRGSGVTGLAAMSDWQKWAPHFLCRPFLSLKREQLEQYALLHQLRWVDDESNADLCFNRNYLRHEVFPRFQKRWPECVKTLARTAKHCAEANSLLHDLAKIDLLKDNSEIANCSCFQDEPLHCQVLLLSSLRELPESRRLNVLRYWLAHHRIMMPTAKKLKTMDDLIDLSRRGDQGKVVLSRSLLLDNEVKDQYINKACTELCELFCWNDAFYLNLKIINDHSNKVFPWNLESDLSLPQGLGVVTLDSVLPYVDKEWDRACFTLRFRQGGERIKLRDEVFHRSLKTCFQLWGVPPWCRERTPLLYYQERLVLVVGFPFRSSCWKQKECVNS